jgi:predicted glycoside hydrolase/deacetylase ChbG (UPF0249 family)
MRAVIVNADDFGLCPSVNNGIVLAHDNGIVTSTSLMVRQPAAAEAAAMAATRPGLAVGLHLDLGEWTPQGEWEWVPRYEFVDTTDAVAVRAEIAHQLALFIELVGRPPTHLDGHQHVQRQDAVASPLREIAQRLDVPLRLQSPGIAYCGEFYGQDGRGRPYPEGISVEHLCEIMRSLPDGCTELACHPGIGVLPTVSTYADERERECVALCDPRVIEACTSTGVTLTSFAQLALDA